MAEARGFQSFGNEKNVMVGKYEEMVKEYEEEMSEKNIIINNCMELLSGIMELCMKESIEKQSRLIDSRNIVDKIEQFLHDNRDLFAYKTLNIYKNN